MRSVFKYPLQVTDVQRVDTFEGWQPLVVQMQDGVPTLWALVDDKRPPRRQDVFIHGTGHPVFDEATNYVGTFQLEGGYLVFHVFTGSGQ